MSGSGSPCLRLVLAASFGQDVFSKQFAEGLFKFFKQEGDDWFSLGRVDWLAPPLPAEPTLKSAVARKFLAGLRLLRNIGIPAVNTAVAPSAPADAPKADAFSPDTETPDTTDDTGEQDLEDEAEADKKRGPPK